MSWLRDLRDDYYAAVLWVVRTIGLEPLILRILDRLEAWLERRPMSDLIEFLRARLDEDEEWAQAAQDGDGYAEWDNPSTGVVQVAGGDLDGLALAPRNAAVHIARHDPARVLRSVEADRRILELHSAEPGQHPDFCGHDQHELPCPTLRLLALPYADHPDYREEWRP